MVRSRTIGVYITSFNQIDFLRSAILSVLSQTRQPDQIVVVDDASEDGSQSEIRAIASQHIGRFDTVFLKKNIGIARVRRQALLALDTDFVTYLDGDDIFLPRKLELEEQALARSGAQIAFSDFLYIDANASVIRRWAEGQRPPQGDVFRHVVARQFPRRTLFRSELVARDAWLEVGLHRQDLTLYEDFEMKIRLTRALETAYVDTPLSGYRLHGHGLSNRPLIRHVEQSQKVLNYAGPLLASLAANDRQNARSGFRSWQALLLKNALIQATDPDSGLTLSERAWTFGHALSYPTLLRLVCTGEKMRESASSV